MWSPLNTPVQQIQFVIPAQWDTHDSQKLPPLVCGDLLKAKETQHNQGFYFVNIHLLFHKNRF